MAMFDNIKNFFRPVSTWSVDQIRTFLKEEDPQGYNLIDVRQPSEYERGHLPGARLIPLGQLPSRLHELDPDKPTITY